MLTESARGDLRALLRTIDTPAEAEAALRDLLPALIQTYGAAAATLAADWYDDLRDELEVRGRFTAIPADAGDRGAQALAGWAVVEATSLSTLEALVAGGLQRRVADAARETITGSSLADPRATGWQRVGAGSCAFCAMLIGRGAVYSEAGADFASHDHCNCSAAPAFEGKPRPVKPYTPSTRTSTDADRARVREYLRTH